MKRNYEIDDTLNECADSAIEEVKEYLLEYLDENKPYSLPCISNDLDYSGRVHEIVDGSVPIYTKEIEDAWYLHASELEQAYENAGVGDNPRENDGMAAIYCFISDKVHEWYQSEAEEVFDEWKEKEKEEMAFPPEDELVESLIHVRNGLEDPEPDCDDDDMPGIDVRIQCEPGKGWQLHTGDSQYDQSHKGYWGASSISKDMDDDTIRSIASEMIDQAREMAAQ